MSEGDLREDFGERYEDAPRPRVADLEAPRRVAQRCVRLSLSTLTVAFVVDVGSRRNARIYRSMAEAESVWSGAPDPFDPPSWGSRHVCEGLTYPLLSIF